MKIKFIIGIVIGCFLLLAILLSANNVGLFTLNDQNDTIKIGFINPASGAMAYTGYQVETGFYLAYSLNKKIGNKKIEIVAEDDKCDPKEAVAAANKLLGFDNVNIIIDGVCSSSVLSVAPITESKQKILLSSVAASPKISNLGEYVYRVSSSSEYMAKQTADLLYRKDYKNIGILYEQNDYPVGWKDSFIKNFKGKIIFQEFFISNDQELKTTVTKIKDRNVDAILIVVLSLSSGQKVLTEFGMQGINKQLIGNEIFTFEPILKMKESQNMLVSIYDYNLDSSEMKMLFEQYKNKYGNYPEEPTYVVLGFDSYMLVYNAIKSCNSDVAICVKNYLDNIDGISGAMGQYYLDKNGDGIRKLTLKRIVNNDLLPIQ